MLLIGCGLFSSKEERWEGEAGALAAVSETPTGTLTPPVVSETAPGIGAPTMVAPVGYDGPTSLEERIFASPVIARVRLDSATSTVELGTTYQGTKYIALLEFSFSVQEYLKGRGADDIVAVWAAAPFFDTQQEAEDALPAIAAARDAQWDAHESIVFLQEDSRGFLSSTQQADRYYLAWGGSKMMYADQDDVYSIASRHNKLWLPASAAVGATSQGTGDQQRFLTDVPPATGAAPTITLEEIKTRIGAITAKLDAGDGSEEYRECVQLTYEYEGTTAAIEKSSHPDPGAGLSMFPLTIMNLTQVWPREVRCMRMNWASAKVLTVGTNYGSTVESRTYSAWSSATRFPTIRRGTE